MLYLCKYRLYRYIYIDIYINIYRYLYINLKVEVKLIFDRQLHV